MANGKTGTLIFDGNQGMSIRLYWSETYDANANTSVLSITAAELRSYTYYGTWYFSGSISINGAAAVSMSSNNPATHLSNVTQAGGHFYAIQTASGVAPPWTSGTLAHNPDGTLTVPVTVNLNLFRFSPNNQQAQISHTINVELTPIPRPYTLTITKDAAATVSVKKGSTVLNSGATVYTGDNLKIEFSASTGYLVTCKVNNAVIQSGNTHVVSGNVSVVVTAEAQGLVFIDTGAQLEAYQIFIDSGSEWKQYIPYIDNGSNFKLCS